MKSRRLEMSREHLDQLRKDLHESPDRPHRDHLSDEELVRYTMGTLGDEETRICDLHLLACRPCCEALERMLVEYEKHQQGYRASRDRHGLEEGSRSRDRDVSRGGGADSRQEARKAISPIVVVIASVVLLILLAGLLLPVLSKAKSRPPDIRCIANLKQLGIAAVMYANDHGGRLPPNYVAMSNELSSPKILVCPSDRRSVRATDWAELSSSNITYEFLVPGSELSNVLNRAVFRCPIHNSSWMGNDTVDRQ